ncbi:GNAT family protein [Brevundimonas phoenicis]|uniref:hypothetical protein n=1 Tax=unclassified Brevundimonas TaxID=2622653 RepID=UPI0039A0C637
MNQRSALMPIARDAFFNEIRHERTLPPALKVALPLFEPHELQHSPRPIGGSRSPRRNLASCAVDTIHHFLTGEDRLACDAQDDSVGFMLMDGAHWTRFSWILTSTERGWAAAASAIISPKR